MAEAAIATSLVLTTAYQGYQSVQEALKQRQQARMLKNQSTRELRSIKEQAKVEERVATRDEQRRLQLRRAASTSGYQSALLGGVGPGAYTGAATGGKTLLGA